MLLVIIPRDAHNRVRTKTEGVIGRLVVTGGKAGLETG